MRHWARRTSRSDCNGRPRSAAGSALVVLGAWLPGMTVGAWAQSQLAPCPLGKSVRFSGAPITAASDMLPNGRCYRVSMSARGELCYTSSSPTTGVPQWVLFEGRGSVPPGVYGMLPSGEAWDIAADVMVGADRANGVLRASSWDLVTASSLNPPPQVSIPHPLPSGGTDPSALVGVAETGTPARVCGWASEECAEGPGATLTTHAYWGWVPPILGITSQWLGEISGQGCPADATARAESEARHVNILGFPVGRLFGTPAMPGSCLSISPTSPFQLPFVDAVRWKAMVPGSPGVPTQLSRLQLPNGARAERTSEMGYTAGWSGHTASPLCGQVGPVPGSVHATVWDPPALGGVVDLQAATLPFAGSSVAAAIEETGGNNIGLTVGGQRDGSTAVLWRQCAGWTAIDVADIVFEATPRGGSGHSWNVSRIRSDKFQVVTDVTLGALFAGFCDGAAFTVTRFEDIDSNLRVDAMDIVQVLAAYGPPAPASFADWDTRDVNDDGNIDSLDLVQVLAQYTGAGLVNFPNICGCALTPVEERVPLSDAIRLCGSESLIDFERDLSADLEVEPILAEARASCVVEVMFGRSTP